MQENYIEIGKIIINLYDLATGPYHHEFYLKLRNVRVNKNNS